MQNFTVDLHCHPHSKAYSHAFRYPGPPYQHSTNPNKKNSVWWSDLPSEKDLKRNVDGLFGLTTFTQSDFRKCIDGNVGVIFASLNQFEKGFTQITAPVPRFINKGKLTDWAVGKVTEFEKKRLKYVREQIDDYFPDVVNEYNFLKQHSGKVKNILGQSYRYQMVNSHQEIIDGLNATDVDHKLMVVNTIEGAQSLGTGIELKGAYKNIDLLLDRIQIIKNWKYPPFFITFTHHFYNELCGHARSLGILKAILNQDYGINRSFTAAGILVREALLDNTNGKRILIDVKHMNRKSRIQYYDYIKKRGYDIPIIVSHAAVTGQAAPGKDSVLGKVKHLFASDSINFYDDELVEIERSNGLFGIQLDERRVASTRKLKKIKGLIGRELLTATSKLLWRQIRHIAEVLDHHGEYSWALPCIGSDFDGMVDPINGFFTSSHFKNLDYFLLLHAQEYIDNDIKRNMNHSMNINITADEIVSRVLQENAMNFLQANFN